MCNRMMHRDRFAINAIWQTQTVTQVDSESKQAYFKLYF